MWDDDERKGEGETRCQLRAYSSRKAPRRPPGLTTPSDGQITINSIICLLNIQGVNDIDCQKNMGDTSQSTYQKCLIQFCSISYFNFYVLKPDVFSTGTVRMFTINQLFGSL